MYIESYNQNLGVECHIQCSNTIQFKDNSENTGESLTEVDQNVAELSSVKLLSILRLSNIQGCELDEYFIQAVKKELNLRKHDTVWFQPH